MLYKMLRDGAAGGRAGHSGSREHRSDPECLRPESVGAWHVEPAAAVDGVNRAPRRVNVAATATHTRVRKGAAGESRYSAIHPEIRQCRIEGLRPPLTSPPASFLLRKKSRCKPTVDDVTALRRQCRAGARRRIRYALGKRRGSCRRERTRTRESRRIESW
jgi:hypothetical protein